MKTTATALMCAAALLAAPRVFAQGTAGCGG